MGWLTTRATFGYDVVNRDDLNFFPTGKVADLGDNRAGVLIDNRFQISQTTVDLGAVGAVPALAVRRLEDVGRRAVLPRSVKRHLRQRPRAE